MLQCARIYAAVVCGTRWSSYRRRSRRGDRAVRVERDCDVIVGNGEVESSLMGRFFPDLAALRLGFSWGHIARPLQATAAIRPVQTGNGTAFTRWPGRVHRECINDTASEPRSWATHATPIRDFAVRRVPVCRVLFLPDVPHGAIPRFIPKLIDSITPSTRTTVSNNL
jgi:hypothetical protein